ncbi:MAG TPA: mannosyltransferase family protein [Solirubrobacteraceae bacterium]
MSSDTAEPAIAHHPSDHARSVGAVAVGTRADSERATAARDVWRALWSSRLLVWIAGSGAVATLGFGPVRHAFNPPGITRGFGWLGDVLAAPAARWDAAWYLVIAHYGYRPYLGAFTSSRTAFFPLYPLGVRALSDLGLAPVIAGVVLSIGAFMAALYGLHRLTTLEVARLRRRLPHAGLLGGGSRGNRLTKLDSGEVARLTVLLTAFAPMAFYFSAIYSESLYLALSVGLFLCARRGRWASAATLGALAAATRSTGVVLIAPLLLLYLYGPREDRDRERTHEDQPLVRARDRSFAARGRPTLVALVAALRPRYRLRRDALWMALVPLGLALYMAHLALAGGDLLAPFHAETVWSRHFAGPYGGIWDGAKAALAGLRQLLSFQRHHVYYTVAGGSPFIDAGHNLLLFVFLLMAIPAVIGVLWLLPIAYGVYALAALALPLSYPVAPQPLMSLPRFLVVLFPLNMWLAVTLASRPRALTRAVLVLSCLAMMFFVGEFSTWHWVA